MQRSTWTIGAIIVGLAIQFGCKPPTAYQTPPPPQVTAVKPSVETIPVFHEENGETEAVEQAVVRARVQGILEEIKLQPNMLVKEGTELFVIEQTEYRAAVKSATATVGSAQAALVAAKAAVGVADAGIAAAEADIKVSQAEYDRLAGLYNSKAVSTSEVDTARAALETALASKQGADANHATALADITNAQAALEKAEADLTQRELDLKWTVVKAPISGRVTRTLVKRGNLVQSGTELVEIVMNDPIWANFNISERFLLDLERASERNDDRIDPTSIKVFLKRSGDDGFPFEGHLDYFDPRIDQDTGTLMLRAVFRNNIDEQVLLPGLFVRVRIQIGTLEDAMMIPTRSISRDQAGSFVYVVTDDSKAERKNVQLGPKHAEMTVVLSGIDANDSVIVDGIQRVRTGVPVDAK